MTDTYRKEKNLVDALSETLDRHPEVAFFCFDYFDTLVYRIVDPEDTKRLACRQLSIALGGDPEADALYQWRKDFELTLCGQNKKKGLDPEFSLYDLAAVFHEFLVPRYPSITGLYDKDRFTDLLIQIEMTIELQVQRMFPDTEALLSSVKKHGASIVLISDFYIPGALFRRFLDRHGISRYVDRLFVSCDYGLTKFTGRLYGVLIEHLGAEPETFFMIGDRENADVLIPASRKMKSMG
ncbi:MAG: HAD family hydrolase, partial [Deltaproteobacteria bacterium]|nr:HAD family hydrolase [Deltaproteobacteria bacterium]